MNMTSGKKLNLDETTLKLYGTLKKIDVLNHPAPEKQDKYTMDPE